MIGYINISYLLSAVLVLFIIYRLLISQWLQVYKLAFFLPGPPALPIIGNALLATNSTALFDLGNTLYQKYGPLSRIWIAILPSFLVVEPNDLQHILATYKNTDKHYLYTLIHNFLGEGLITSNGVKWKIHRKLIQPLFHTNILKMFVDIFSKGSSLLMDELKCITDQQADINIALFINNSVLGILHEAVLGIATESNNDIYKISPYRKGKVVAQTRVEKPWLLLNSIYHFTNSSKDELDQKKNLYSFTKKMINLRKENVSKYGREPNKVCLMDMMIEIGKNHPEFTDDEIISEVCTFMLAGQDSVSSAVAFSLYFLAENPLIQGKVFDEQCEIFNNPEITVNAHTLNKMKYLEQCIKETMRLCPSVPLMGRKLGENITIGKYVLPSGTNILISPFVSHRLPHIFPNPRVFDPERFTPEEIEKRHPFAYLPFSAGPRNCIGYKFAMLEMKTIISDIIRRFNLSVSPGYTFNLTFRVTLRAKGGVWLRLRPRKI